MAHEPHKRTIQELITTAKALHSKVQQSEGKTAQLSITLGLTLKEAKERKPEDITWPDFVKKHFDFGRSRADELIQIADGRTTVEKTRADKAASVATSKAKLKDQAAATSGGSPQPTTDAPKEDQAEQIADAGSPADAVKAAADRAAIKTPKPVSDVTPAADRAEVTSATAKAKPIDACDEMPDVEAPAGTTPAEQRHFNFIYRCSEAIAYGKQNGLDDAESEEITIEIIAAARHAADVWSALVFELERRRAGKPSEVTTEQPKVDRTEQAAQRKAKRGERLVAKVEARQPEAVAPAPAAEPES